jgi:hypothetical protein
MNKVIKPTTLTSAMLVSTTAVETYAEWAAGTAYALNAYVTLAATNRTYQCIQGPSTGNPPATSPLYWSDVGPTNKWAMFDGEISTQTSKATALTVVLKPGYVNSLSLFGMEGTNLTVTVRDALAGEVVYGPISINLDGTVIDDWYQYFFEPYVQKGDVVLTNLPPYGDAHITITIASGGDAKCGTVSLGTFYKLGDTLTGAVASIIDFSRKTTSAAGVTSFERRDFSKRMSLQIMLPNSQLNKVQRVLADLRATPCTWVATEAPGFEPLTVYGFFRDFSIDVAYHATSLCSIEIEGLS